MAEEFLEQAESPSRVWRRARDGLCPEVFEEARDLLEVREGDVRAGGRKAAAKGVVSRRE